LGTGISAISDSTGKYVLEGVSAGYWTIHFSKPDFCDYYTYPVEFVGNGVLQLWNAFAAPALGRTHNWNSTLAIPTITKSYDPSVAPDTEFHITFAPGTSHVLDSTGKDHFSVYGTGLCSLVGKVPNINYQDSNSYISYRFNVWPTISNEHSGDTIYMVIYPVACGGSAINYYVGDKLVTALTGLGPPSNTVQIVLP